MNFEIIAYDFDRNESKNMMMDGHHYGIEAPCVTWAVTKFIDTLAETEGANEVTGASEDLVVTAYKLANGAWEVHLYMDELDECFIHNI